MKKIVMAALALSMIFALGVMNVSAQQVTWDDPYTQTDKLKELAADTSLYGITDPGGVIMVITPSITVAGTAAATPQVTKANDIVVSPKGTVFAVTDDAVGTWSEGNAFVALTQQPKVPGGIAGTYKHVAYGDGGKLFVLFEGITNTSQYILIGHEINTEMTVRIDPQTLNLASKGKWVDGKITLPEGSSAKDIDPGSVNITAIEIGGTTTDLATLIPGSQAGASKGHFKFSRVALSAAITALLPADASGKIPVTVTVTLALTTGEQFEGTSTFNALVPKSKKK
jgi:hypothetical protein